MKDNSVFDANIGGIITINYINKKKVDSTILYDGNIYDKSENISTTSNDELLNKFKQIIKPLCEKDNLLKHIRREPDSNGTQTIEYNPNGNWWIVSVTRLRGYKGMSDFYTYISNNSKEINKRIGLYKDVSKTIINTKDTNNNNSKKFNKKLLEYYFPFNTGKEMKNFINYLKTDFFRICLYFNKRNMNNLTVQILNNIPYFDFSDDTIFNHTPYEIDNILFKKYNISDNIRKHIENILPDYYNIRKGLK